MARVEPPDSAAASAKSGATSGRKLGPAPSAAFAALVLTLLMGLQPITTDLMLPALPAMALDLHAGMGPVQLTMSALILSFGLAQLVWGPVADRIGRRPVLLAGLVLYSVASLGAALAGQVATVVAWRALQGAAMSAAVVCARAMVRDLYAPHQGAMVMARALTGLGAVAVASPLVAGLLVSGWGWRAAVLAMAVVGLAVLLFIALRLPETAPAHLVESSTFRPVWRQLGRIVRNPTFRAWALLVGCSYGGIYIFLAGSGFVLIRVLGLAPAQAGVVMSSCSLGYIAGTLLCRRWIPRLGLAGAVARASWLTCAAAAGLVLAAITDTRSVLALMLPIWAYSMGHGVHNPCGQAGSVGPFPHAAGMASALAGFVLGVVAFGIGLWLGHALDGTVRPFAAAMATAAMLTVLVARTLVQRHGDRVVVA